MSAEERGAERDSIVLEAHGPAGFWGRITGLNAQNVLLFLLVAMMGVLLYMIKSSDDDRDRRYVDLQRQIAEMLKQSGVVQDNQRTILQAIASTTEEQRSITYVLTLNERERKLLNLTMPASLRDRVR